MRLETPLNNATNLMLTYVIVNPSSVLCSSLDIMLIKIYVCVLL